MGAFILVLLINRVALGKRYTKRASLLAFVIACGVSIPLAAFGFSTETVTPLQQLPFVALGYGKFALALLFIDLYNARRVTENPGYVETRTRWGFPPSPAWAAAFVIIAIGSGVSFLLPQPTATAIPEGVAPVVSAPSPDIATVEWQPVSPADSLFTVKFPGKPTYEESSTPSPRTGGSLPVHSWAVDGGTRYFGLTEMRMRPSDLAPDATAERVIEGSFSGVLKAWAADNMTYTIAEKSFERYGEWPALTAKAVVVSVADTITARMRILLVGRQLYSLTAITPDASDADRFFGSFGARAADTQRLPLR